MSLCGAERGRSGGVGRGGSERVAVFLVAFFGAFLAFFLLPTICSDFLLKSGDHCSTRGWCGGLV